MCFSAVGLNLQGMMKNSILKKGLKWAAGLVAVPVLLFLVLAVLVYLPPVQRFAVDKATQMLSQSMGLHVEVGAVRLAFPLDLALHDLLATDAEGDTLVDAGSVRLDVRLLPLLKGRADIDGLSLYDARLNTKSLIPDTEVRGTVGELTAASHGVEWTAERVHLDRVRLSGGNLWVALGDTAAPDTTPSTSRWDIALEKAEISHTALRLSLPGDTLRISARLGGAQLADGRFDTGRAFYGFRLLEITEGFAAMHTGVQTEPFFRWHATLPPPRPDGEAPPFDLSRIELSGLNLRVDTLSYDSAGTLRMGLRRLVFAERCGLNVKGLSGEVYFDSALLRLPVLHLATDHSRLDAGAELDWKALTEGRNGRCNLTLDAELGHADVLTLGSAFVEKDFLNLYPQKPLVLTASVGGNLDRLEAEGLTASMEGVLRLEGKGSVKQLLDKARSGEAEFSLQAGDLNFVKGFLPAEARGAFALPRGMRAKGTAAFSGEDYRADVRLNAVGGSLSAKARAHLGHESYAVTASAKAFPLGSFLPGMGLDKFSGRFKASGAGFDVLSPRTRLKAEAAVEGLGYKEWDLGGIRLDAALAQGEGVARFASENALLQGEGTLTAAVGDTTRLTLDAHLPFIDIASLGGMTDTLQVGGNINIAAFANRALTAYGAQGLLSNIYFLTPRKSIPAKDVDFAFASAPDTTTARIAAGDLSLGLAAQGNVDTLLTHVDEFAALLEQQLSQKTLDQNALKTTLPVASIYAKAGTDNPLSNILRYKGYTYNSARLNLNTGPRRGFNGFARVGTLRSGGLLLDTIDFDIRQDTTGVVLDGGVRNFTKRNPNKFDTRLKAYLLSSGAGAEVVFYDSKGKKGVDLGMRADVVPEGISVKLYPAQPVIAYRGFTLNPENFIFLGRDRSVRADVDLLADDGTGLKLYGEPVDSTNDLTLSLHRVNLAELSEVLPYLPQMGGLLSGDFHLTDDRQSLSAVLTSQAADFKFEGVDLGSIGLEGIYLPKSGGEHHAQAFISSNEQEVLECSGVYLDSTATFAGEARLHDFPLQMLNGFLAGTDVALSGKAGGEIAIAGSLDAPEMNGALDLDSCHLVSDVYGLNFRLDERPVRIVNSRMLFENYSLYSSGKSPLVIDGALDMADLSRIGLDFKMDARNFELINTKKKPKSMVFGKVYTNFQGTLRGTPDRLSVRGKLEVLDRTDMTYILKDSPLSVDDRLKDLVQFVSFEDSVEIEETSAVPTDFDLTLGISVSDAARFHCNLSEDGQNYVDLEGGGDLTLRLTQQGDMRLTGRFTANSGEMKYALPIIPLKTFKLVQGSYVEFTGEVMNPTLNIAAKERVKAVVTENEQPRSVAFDVGVAITKPLESMGLEFTIEAPEDLAVQNQLAAMTREQRGKAAVTMLATGMYLTDEGLATGSGFKASNALNAFLQSEIQHIAGSALRTIDINLGVESGTSSAGTSTTDYSFQFAKRFWGNRISVIIGGKVSTGSDAENSAASIIDNVSMEYRLDKSSTRYVRLFYDRDTQDPLEGQLTKTGAGLVLRRKTDRLGELFLFKKKK